MRCYVLPHGRADGPANMARDEALLDAAVADPESAWFRTYGWSVPTLSLGYFQQAAERDADPRWRGVPFVRRPTGGGALWHHHELTYALAVPREHPLARRHTSLYQAVHEVLAELLRDAGLPASRRGPVAPGIASGKPFLCFTDRDPADIVASGSKIVGSAQRRRSGAILQHGSMLLAHSSVTPELSGASDLGALVTAEHEWASLVRDRVPRALGFAPVEQPFEAGLVDRGRVLEDTVYRHDSWNRRR